MSKDYTYDFSAALADEELSRSEKNELLESLGSDPDFQYDLKIQNFIKNIIQDKCSIKNAPASTRTEIEKKIRREVRLKASDPKFYSRPLFRYGAAAVLLIAFILILFNRTPQIGQPEFAVEQTGSNNMFVQAKNNFQSILAGKLAPQMVSSSAEEIQQFFSQNGVNYETVVPEYNEWQLLGAVISEDKGEKFAHHVYAADNQLVYLYQVEERFIKQNVINLSSDLLQYLDNGNCYSYTEEKNNILFTKAGNNIVAVVSNADPEKLKSNFCAIN